MREQPWDIAYEQEQGLKAHRNDLQADLNGFNSLTLQELENVKTWLEIEYKRTNNITLDIKRARVIARIRELEK